MSYSDILNNYSGSMWRYSDLSQGTAWTKKGTTSSWAGTIRKASGAKVQEGFEGDGWNLGSAQIYLYSQYDSAFSQPGRPTTFLIKVDPEVATGSHTLFRLESTSTSGYSLSYNADTDMLDSTPAGLADGKWHHVALNRNSGDAKFSIYVDGVAIITDFAHAAGNSNTRYTYFMPYNQTIVPGITMDEITVYPNAKSLSEATIQAQADYVYSSQNGTHIDFTTTPATAEAVAVDPAVEAIIDPNFTYSAGVATATAMAGDAEVEATTVISAEVEADIADATAIMPNPGYKAAKNFRMLATGSFFPSGHTAGNSLFTTQRLYGTHRQYYVIGVPRLTDPNLNEGANVLTLHKPSNHAGTVEVYRATKKVTESGYNQGSLILTHVDGTLNEANITVPVPNDVSYLYLEVSRDGGQSGRDMALDNPAIDTEGNTGSFFTIEAIEKLFATPATATGEMLNATAGVTAGVSYGATVATASAEMLNGVFPDANTSADLMTATGLMGAAWFRSGRKVAVDAAQATAEALEIESVTSDRNVIVEAATAHMSNAWINNPLEVNEDVNDPYWTRVIRKSTDGALPPSAVNWFRFNERTGNLVRRYDSLTGLPVTDQTQYFPTATLAGAFSWGRPGPNGRRAVRIENAGLNVQRDDTWSAYIGHSYLTEGASLEFTVKIDPGHTGRMDIANGVMLPWSTPGTVAKTHVSVRDGRLYAVTGPGDGKGGTSFRRLDDGKFHHIVITPRVGDYWVHDRGEAIALDIYIDGVLDRSFLSLENIPNASQAPDARFFARPDYYFGQDTGYPFKGEILEVIYRQSSMNSSQVMDLYLDMFGFKATRAGIVGAAVGAMGDAKVESNMKRMLVLSFNGNVWHDINFPDVTGDTGLTNPFGALVTSGNPQHITEMMLHGEDGNYAIGNYLMTHQQVEFSRQGDASWEFRRDRGEPEFQGFAYQFRDEKTGLHRLIDIYRDIDLDDFDVIFVQRYPNPPMNTQRDRELYEPFLNNLNKALIEGRKLWITDPYLAYDLGWITDVDEVPVLRRNGNDVRSVDVHPRGKGLFPRPADGSMPVLPKGRPQGSGWGLYNLYRWDFHHNNGYRVVNEIDGLTNLPTWEVEELYVRDRTEMLPNGAEWEQRGYKLVNRTGDDFEWTRAPRFSPDEVYEMVKPSTGAGLKAGDEFYDYTWYENGWLYFKYFTSTSSQSVSGLLNRAGATWAIPPGHLKIGTPVSTFRSTLHDDFGNEVANPYRNHIRNAVVRPGDRLPDGRKVMGYAVMEFATRPDIYSLTGDGVKKQLTLPPEYFEKLTAADPKRDTATDETARSFEWDYFTEPGRWIYGGNASTVTSTKYTISYGNGSGGAGGMPTFTAVSTTLPIAESRDEAHPTVVLPHQNWVSRGLSWLFTLDRVETEYSNVAVQAATASGRMTDAQIDTEFDNEVSVGAAQATATIVAPEQAQVKEAKVMAFAASASGKMNGLVGGYKAEVADGFATMPQNVTRPLDIEEVLFFTVTMNTKTINLRMEEN